MLKIITISSRLRSRRQSGDTLIEVTFALAILAFVLISTTTVAAKAFVLGGTAGERTSVVNVAQEQMEVLHAFRDNHTWNEFLYGNLNPTGGTPYAGVLSTRGTTGCHITTTFTSPPACFHMELRNTGPVTTEQVPVDGTSAGTVPTSYIEMIATPDDPINPKNITITIDYGFNGRGGGTFTGDITTLLTNIKITAP